MGPAKPREPKIPRMPKLLNELYEKEVRYLMQAHQKNQLKDTIEVDEPEEVGGPLIVEELEEVCTGVMMHGYSLVKKLCSKLQDFMKMHDFQTIEEFRGALLQYFTTHTDLVRRRQEAIQQRKAIKKGLQSDKDWTGL